MKTQSHPSAHWEEALDDHVEPDSYLDPNHHTLDDVVQQFSVDQQVNVPWIVWLVENPDSAIALPGKIDLYGHDCLHAILNRGHSPADEAFVLGFTLGNNTRTSWLHKLLFKLISVTLYPKKYRFSWQDLHFFDAGFVYGRSLQARNLNQLDFSAYQHHPVSQVRKQLGISKANEIERLQSFRSPRP